MNWNAHYTELMSSVSTTLTSVLCYSRVTIESMTCLDMENRSDYTPAEIQNSSSYLLAAPLRIQLFVGRSWIILPLDKDVCTIKTLLSEKTMM